MKPAEVVIVINFDSGIFGIKCVRAQPTISPYRSEWVLAKKKFSEIRCSSRNYQTVIKVLFRFELFLDICAQLATLKTFGYGSLVFVENVAATAWWHLNARRGQMCAHIKKNRTFAPTLNI